MQQRCHLVDEGAGAAGADAVHPLFQAAPEVDDLGILTAQLNGYVGLRGGVFQRRGHCHHFLNEGNVQSLAKVDGAGAGDLNLQAALTQGFFCHHQQGVQGLLGVGVVAAVISEENFAVFIQNNQLDGGGAHVNAGTIGFHMVCLLYVLPPTRGV